MNCDCFQHPPLSYHEKAAEFFDELRAKQHQRMQETARILNPQSPPVLHYLLSITLLCTGVLLLLASTQCLFGMNSISNLSPASHLIGTAFIAGSMIPLALYYCKKRARAQHKVIDEPIDPNEIDKELKMLRAKQKSRMSPEEYEKIQESSLSHRVKFLLSTKL